MQMRFADGEKAATGQYLSLAPRSDCPQSELLLP